MTTLPVSEVFGSLQGEGPAAGRQVTFIRLGGCNLSCSWCDTPYTWDSSRYQLKVENPPTDITAVLARVTPGRPVVLTGGEPLIHQHRQAWSDLLDGLAVMRCDVHVETNGTIEPNEVTRRYVAHYSVSPKLPNAGEHGRGQDPTLAPGWDALMGATVALKFVCADVADAEAAVELADAYGMPREQVWLMPEGRDVEKLTTWWPFIASAAVRLGVNASHRLHVLAWGDTKGT